MTNQYFQKRAAELLKEAMAMASEMFNIMGLELTAGPEREAVFIEIMSGLDTNGEQFLTDLSERIRKARTDAGH